MLLVTSVTNLVCQVFFFFFFFFFYQEQFRSDSGWEILIFWSVIGQECIKLAAHTHHKSHNDFITSMASAFFNLSITRSRISSGKINRLYLPYLRVLNTQYSN